MVRLGELLGGGSTLGPTLQTNFFTSRNWVAPQNGIVVVRAMGAGGGGAGGSAGSDPSSGGYSASWGAKIVRVSEGDTISVVVGAPGAAGSASPSGVGGAGGDTIVTIGGVAHIAYGGPGGVKVNAPLPNGPSPSANWDFGADSVKPGVPAPVSGGAGVDILAQGGNVTTSNAISNISGGGGTGSAGTGAAGGGAAPNGYSVLGEPPSNPGKVVDAGGGDWGISFYGGSGGLGSGAAGGNGGGGGGGSGSTIGGIGGNGGGGGSSATAAGAAGGNGGGGGGSYTNTGGVGGAGFAHLKFYADMGV